MTRGDLAIDAVLVVSAVGGERGERAINLIEQGTDLRSIVDVAGGQNCRGDLAGVGVHGNMRLAPRPPCFRAVLLKQPLARATELQSRAVHQKVHGTSLGPRTKHLQRLRSAAECRVVRHREIETKQGDDGADEPLGLAWRQAEYRPRRQRRGDRQARTAWLSASRGPGLRFPCRNSRVGEPDGQAPRCRRAAS